MTCLLHAYVFIAAGFVNLLHNCREVVMFLVARLFCLETFKFELLVQFIC